MKKAKLFWQDTCELGEGPVYDHRSNELFWVDITKGVLFRKAIDGPEITTHTFNPALGFAIPATESGKMILGLSEGVSIYDLAGRSLQVVCRVEEDFTQNRFNDGKCDPEGRLWMGTMGYNADPSAGSLYSLTRGKLRKHLTSLTISNGMVWSPGKFYFIDTATQKVQVFDCDITSGEIHNPGTLAIIDGELGAPDGMTIDTNGNLWIALWGGSRVICIDGLKGEIIDEIMVPVPNVTSCTFGGPDFSNLYITTARTGLSAEQLDRYPESGSVFFCALNVKGQKTDFYEI